MTWNPTPTRTLAATGRRARLLVWLTCLALLWGGAMAGWGRLASGDVPASADLLADVCVAVPLAPADADGSSGGDTALAHAQVHCAMCVAALGLPELPTAIAGPHPEAAAGSWPDSARWPLSERLAWQRPPSHGPPERT